MFLFKIIRVINLPIIQNYVDTGGKIIILLGEGGEHEFNTNINFFLEQYGMTINNGR